MNKKYRVRLTDEERNTQKSSFARARLARKLTYARILLKADEDEPA